MKTSILLWVLLVVPHLLRAQTVTIRDQKNDRPLEGVTLSCDSPKAFATTDARGQADISAFRGGAQIVLMHQQSKPLSFSYEQLAALRFTIDMPVDHVALKDVIVQSDRWSESKLEAPGRIEKINMKEAAFQNPQTTADLLGTSGYAFIQKSQLGGGSPMLRGYATNRVLFVVDGVRMNTAIFRAGNLQNVISLDANAMESTEILFGPGSVMYGSDAIGGVMSFTTLEPGYADRKWWRAEGNALMRTSSANSESTAHIDANYGTRKLAFVTSFTSSAYGDLRSGSWGGVPYFYRRHYVTTIDNKDYMVPNTDSTLQVGSKYSQVNFMQKVRFKPLTNLEFEYGFHFSETSPYNRYDRLYVMQTSGPYKNKLRWAEWYYGPQRWKMHRAGITHTGANVAYDRLKVVGAIQQFEESRYEREFMFREIHGQRETVEARSLNIDLEKRPGTKTTVSYGAELVHNRVGSFADLTHVITKEVDSTVTRYPNGSTWESYGAYLSVKHQLLPKLSVTGGVRYSIYRIEADFDTVLFPFPIAHAVMSNDAWNGSLGFVYTPIRSWQIYVNGASGFRAPNIDDMGKVFESTPGYLVVPNPDLKPEHVYNAETGTVKTFGSYLKIDLAAYYTVLSNGMVRKDYELNGSGTMRYLGNPSRIQAVQNVTRIEVYGFQAGIDFFWKGIGLSSAFSYQNGREQSPDSLVYFPLRHAAPAFGSTHLTYSNKWIRLDLYSVYNARMDYEELALTERINTSYAKDDQGLNYSEGWYTLNFKTAFYLNEHVTLAFGIENIEDRLYRPYSSGINAPGRNFIASLRARF